MIQNKVKVLIIEDEKLSRDRLLRLLKNDSRLSVVGAYEAFEKIEKQEIIHSADILILDISLPGKSGIEIAEFLSEEQIIIYSTAYSRFAVEAFVVRATDYLVKPISKSRLKESINRAISNLKKSTFYSQNKHPSYIMVKNGGNLVKVFLHDVVCIRSDNNHVIIHTNTKEYLVKNSLSKIFSEVGDDFFVRCHRTCVVNLNKITKIIPNGSTKLAELESGQSVPLSRHFLKNYKDQLAKYY